MTPRPESRISTLEKRVSTLEASVEELSSDTAEELRAIRQDNKMLFDHMQKGLHQAHEFMQERFTEINTHLDRIEATMATKEDLSKLEVRIDDKMSAMESRLIEAMKTLFQQRSGE
jgi:uncharacterized coiled-coil protein SlyX